MVGELHLRLRTLIHKFVQGPSTTYTQSKEAPPPVKKTIHSLHRCSIINSLIFSSISSQMNSFKSWLRTRPICWWMFKHRVLNLFTQPRSRSSKWMGKSTTLEKPSGCLRCRGREFAQLLEWLRRDLQKLMASKHERWALHNLAIDLH